MKGFLSGRLLAACATLGLTGLPTMADATELEPYEFKTVPAGTTVFLGYAIYGHDDQFKATGGPKLDDGTNLDIKLSIARLAHYFNIGDTLALIEVLQPIGSLDDARIAGQRFKRSSGFGDTIFAAAVWPINDTQKQTYFGVTLYLTVPTGKYDKLQTVNLGGNRIVYDPQIALHQGFGKRWSIDLTADVILYGDNQAAGVQGAQTLSQKASFQGQAFVNYAWGGGFATSIGYQGFRGGTQRLDGIDNGQKTQFDEVRFVASKFVTPKFQLLGEVNHQFNVDGGFRQKVGFLVRGLYVF
jgi:hypothetical protein